MTAQQAANQLLNANYRPDMILKALEEMEKSAATNSAPTVPQSR